MKDMWDRPILTLEYSKDVIVYKISPLSIWYDRSKKVHILRAFCHDNKTQREFDLSHCRFTGESGSTPV